MLVNSYAYPSSQTLHPAWEDVGTKACKLGVQLKATISCLAAFIDSLQKVADHATAAKGTRLGVVELSAERGDCMARLGSCVIARHTCDVISLVDGRVGHSRHTASGTAIWAPMVSLSVVFYSSRSVCDGAH